MYDDTDSVLLTRVQCRFVDAAHGEAVFADARSADGEVPSGGAAAAPAAGSLAKGTVVLEERPVCAVQSQSHARDTGFGIASCQTCLAFTSTLREELDRLRGLLPDDDAEIIVAWRTACAWLTEGQPLASVAIGAVTPWFSDGEPLRCPACNDAIMPPPKPSTWCGNPQVRNNAITEAWDTIRAIAESYDERATALARLMCEAAAGRLAWSRREPHGASLPDAAAVRGALPCVVAAAEARFSQFFDHYERAAFRWQQPEQRAVLQKLRAALSTVLQAECTACGASAADDGSRACRGELTSQTLFTARLCLDANLHTVVVVNPLWQLAHAALLVPPSPAAAAAPASVAAVEGQDALRVVLDRVPAAALHNMGFALLRLGAKFNHSCEPNAAFVPTAAPVRGRCVILTDAADADEVRISYVDTGLNFDERRKALWHYNFECDCRRCAAEQNR